MARFPSSFSALVSLGVLASALVPIACGSDDKETDGPSGGTKATGGSKSEASGGAPTDGGSGATTAAGAATDAGGAPNEPVLFALGSVVINPEDMRTTYLQVISSLDDGPFDNDEAIEMPGNGTMLARGADVFVGLAEEPTWVRYTARADGSLKETGRLSFLDYGISGIDYGNAIVSEDVAVSVLSGPALAVVWNPTTMEIERTIDLPHLVVEGYDVEVWTTVAHDGLVYIPGRWADWEAGRVRNGVSTTIVDPVAGEIVGIAEDDRCASGGRIVFDDAGYGYVMGDGRNYSAQMFANAANETAPENCLLRIAPGETDFEQDFYYSIPELTGGLESITELDTGLQGSGLGFAKMFYPNELPEGVEPIDFAFWDVPAHKLWRIELGDIPTAHEVDGLPFAAIGFDGSAFRGKLYTGESVDGGATSDVYETDPETNTGKLRFSMDGYFYGLYELTIN